MEGFLFDFMEIWENTNLNDLEGEIWKDIPEYNGIYQISNLGRVKSFIYLENIAKCREKDVKILKPQNSNDYLIVCLYKNKTKKFFKIHRLVGTVFIPNTENKSVINHKNGIKSDNRIENLEWVTLSENTFHAYRKLGFKAKSIFPSKKIICINTGEIYDSMGEAARMNNNHQGTISRVCRGISPHTRGLVFRYL